MLLLLLTIALIWVGRVRIAEYLLENKLDNIYVQNLVVDLDDIGFTSAQIHYLSLKFNYNDISHTLTVHNAQLEYDLSELTEKAQTGGLTEEILAVAVQDKISKNSSSIQSGLDSLATTLPILLNSRLPLQTLKIESMVIASQNSVVSDAFPVSLSMTSSGNQLLARLMSAKWNFNFEKNDRHLKAELLDSHANSKSLLELSFVKNKSGVIEQASGYLVSDVTASKNLIGTLIHGVDTNISGMANLEFSAIEITNGWEIAVSGEIPDIEHKKVIARDMSIAIRVRASDTDYGNHFEIDPTGKHGLYIGILSTDNMTLENMALAAQVKISETSNGYHYVIDSSDITGLRIEKISTHDMNIDKIVWLPSGTLTLTDQLAEFSLASPSSLTFSNLSQPNLTMHEGSLLTILDGVVENGEWRLSLQPQTRLDTTTLQISGIKISKLSGEIPGKLVYSRDEFKYKSVAGNWFSFDQLSTPKLTINQATINPAFEIDSNSGNNILIARNSTLKASEVEFGGSRFTDIALMQYEESLFMLAQEKNRLVWSLSGGDWRGDNTNFQFQDLGVKFNSLSIKPQHLTQNKGNLNLSLTGPVVQYQDDSYELDNITLEAMINADQLTITGSLTPQIIPISILLNLQHDISTGDGGGVFTLKSPLNMSLHAAPVLAMIPAASGLVLQEGTLDFQLESKWLNFHTPSSNLTFDAYNITGLYNDVVFSGLSMGGTTNWPPHKKSQAESSDLISLQANQLKYGAELENLASEFYFIEADTGQLPAIHVNWIESGFLGSRIRAADFTFDPGKAENTLVLGIVGLDMKKLVELQKINGLIVTGSLDGELPVNLSQDGITIAKGWFDSNQDGNTIQYNIDTETANSISSSLTDNALEALSDFTYERLTAEVDYDPSGNLFIIFQIEGNSPGFENGREVHLNIHSQQNILSLLKSLQYSNAESLNQELENKLQQ